MFCVMLLTSLLDDDIDALDEGVLGYTIRVGSPVKLRRGVSWAGEPRYAALGLHR
jgi:hypothetical protein